ncbi:MFS transporter [Luteimonas sp. M1R5S18]|uniref:MFS transporter n=1 Tax=Luteimonas rhizosphaericola TaxID=3042024 RepID=A0ABT6JJG8_9GAMM|nr:MFS transporter [Luteimonas rhizosphaericola]MDH5830822.1 MFS transporter [Luteimonas rhizosphaericola]
MRGSTPPAPTARRRPGLLQSLANIRHGERAAVAVAALFFFCVLTALMLLRPVRDALGMSQGMDQVRWLFVGTALVTLAVNPAFGWLAARLRRFPLLAATYGFFAVGLATFWALLRFAPGAVGDTSGQVFYVWFSVFNLFATMVFWALLAERFDADQGKRLFAPISVGGTLGAIFGPWLTSRLAEVVGTPALLLVAGAFVLAALALGGWLLRLLPDRKAASMRERDGPVGGSAWAGLRAVVRSPYLSGIAGYVLLMTVMATFIYFTRLQMVADVAGDTDARAAVMGRIDMWTQIAVLVLQVTLTGRLIQRFGLGIALALLPVATAVGFIGLAAYGSFVVLVVLEAGNRAMQRGITRPAREALFTVLGREDTYKAKAAIDTFVYRSGDVLGAQVEGLLGRLGFALGGLVGVVVPLAFAWTALGLWLGRAHARRAAPEAAPDASPSFPPPAAPPRRTRGSAAPSQDFP